MRLLDTSFLIDLQRELRWEKSGKAVRYLKKHPKEHFAISTVSVTEFLEGFDDPGEGEKFLQAFQWMELDGPRARTASRIRRTLRQSGQLIGDFDILIAATAFADQMTLVTNNAEHFGRVEGLTVDVY